MNIRLRVSSDYSETSKEFARMQRELNFSGVVAEGMNAIQRHQRNAAPIGKTGKGPHGRIPRSIRAAKLNQGTGGSWTGISRTTYPPAIFTNEGTGLGAKPPRVRPGAPTGKAYFIPQPTTISGGFWHPGIGGKPGGYAKLGWWGVGFEKGASLAIKSFKRKVNRVIRGRV